MTYEPSALLQFGNMDAAFFTFSGTPAVNNPLTPTLVGSSSGFTPTISTNDIQLPAGEYMMRFYGAITRTGAGLNIVYKWRKVGGSLLGSEGATNRELAPGTYVESIDSADAYLDLTSSGSVQIEMTQVDTGITLDTANTHAVIWRVPT
tara:strand:+ start:135 stop:581 length:447 start_codon:yes stop_codon:yes gene_type:complete